MKTFIIPKLTSLAVFFSLTLAALATEPSVETRVAEIRGLHAEINKVDLAWAIPVIPFHDELGGELKRGTLGDDIRKIILNFEQGDHGSTSYEAYYDADGQLAFVYSVTSAWRFAGDGESTIDEVTERRIYFQNDVIVRTLEKKFSFSREGERSAASRLAKNQPFDVSDQAARRYHQPFMELVSADPSRVVVLADDILRADLRLTEPPASANLEDWAVVNIPERRYAKDLNLTPKDAALEILRDIGVIGAGDEAPAPGSFHSDVIAETKGGASVVVTIQDWNDNTIEATRHLVEMAKSLGTWQLMGIGRQIKRWDEHGGKGWEKE